MSAFLWKLVVDLDIVCKHIFLKPAFGPVFGFIATYHLHFFLPPCYQHCHHCTSNAQASIFTFTERHTKAHIWKSHDYRKPCLFWKIDLIENQKDSMQFLVMYDWICFYVNWVHSNTSLQSDHPVWHGVSSVTNTNTNTNTNTITNTNTAVQSCSPISLLGTAWHPKCPLCTPCTTHTPPPSHLHNHNCNIE